MKEKVSASIVLGVSYEETALKQVPATAPT